MKTFFYHSRRHSYKPGLYKAWLGESQVSIKNLDICCSIDENQRWYRSVVSRCIKPSTFVSYSILPGLPLLVQIPSHLGIPSRVRQKSLDELLINMISKDLVRNTIVFVSSVPSSPWGLGGVKSEFSGYPTYTSHASPSSRPPVWSSPSPSSSSSSQVFVLPNWYKQRHFVVWTHDDIESI